MSARTNSIPTLVDKKFFSKVKKKKTEINNNNIQNDLPSCIYYFLKNNILLLSMFFTVIILLYQRYLDVKNERENQKNIKITTKNIGLGDLYDEI
jgi:hypothetical protein